VRANSGFGEGFSRENDASPESVRAPDLGKRRRNRHHDRGRNVEPLRLISDRLRVIAGGHRDNAPLAFGVGELQHAIGSAAILERPGALTRFELEHDVRSA
jgi:hypothetical protein